MTALRRARRLLGIGAAIGVLASGEAHADSLEGWLSLRVPVAYHQGPPGAGTESGLHFDVLFVNELGRRDSRGLPTRLGFGPSLQLRTLGSDHIGYGAGVEGVVIAPRSPFGLALEAGASRWSGQPWQPYGMASLQARCEDLHPFFLTPTTGFYVRSGGPWSGGERELVIGVELGGAILCGLLILVVARGMTHG